jgi:ribosomal protein S18 acetylase RimI-like enzyme
MLARPYADQDLPVLQAALASWIQTAGTCGYCHVGGLPHRVYANLRGRYPVGELVYIWELNQEIVGVTICFRFGTAFDAFVNPEYRGTAHEYTMLRAAIATTQRYIAQFAPEQSVSTDVFSVDAARIELLSKLEFREFRVWDWITERRLSETVPEVELPAGFSLRTATLADAEQLAAVRNAAFGEGWGAEEYREQIMLKPGYNVDHEMVVVAPNGQIAAFTVLWLDELNKVGLFEPVGTDPTFQRRGLARALMLAGLKMLQQAGMATARVEHDASNTAARELYQQLGFRKCYETHGYRLAK